MTPTTYCNDQEWQVFTFGRAIECDVRIDIDGVEPHHMKLESRENENGNLEHRVVNLDTMPFNEHVPGHETVGFMTRPEHSVVNLQ